MKRIKKVFSEYNKWNPTAVVTVLLLAIPFLYFTLTTNRMDNDFWFLINTGRAIVEKGFINTEIFTFHENFAFLPQQWLTDLIFYGIYSKFSIYGMFTLIILMNILIIYLIYKLAMLVSNNAKKVSIIITIIIDLLLIALFVTSRPQLFDIIFYLTELLLIELYIKKKKKMYLYFLPIISLLLINMHASMWFMFFVLLIPYYAEYFYCKIGKREVFFIKPLLIITLISLLVGFINPYGLEAITYLFRSYGYSSINNYILEMKPTSIKKFYLTYILIYLTLYSFYHDKRELKISYFLLFVGTTCLGIMHVKGLLFAYIGMIMPLAHNFHNLFLEKKKPIKLPKVYNVAYTIIIILLGIFVLSNFTMEKEEDMLLYQVANYLDQEKAYNQKIYTGYNEGSYLEYRGFKCYLDPRAEVFLKSNNKQEDILEEFVSLQYKDASEQAFLEKYNFAYLVLQKEDVLHNYLLSSSDYTLVEKYFDKRNEYSVYKKI